MAHLHFDYTTKLMTRARTAIDDSKPRVALGLIAKAFAHVDVMLKSEKIRGDLPVDRIESRRRELIGLISCLPPSIHC